MEPSRRFGLSACHRGPLIWSLLFPELSCALCGLAPPTFVPGCCCAAPTGNNGRTDRASVLQPLATGDRRCAIVLASGVGNLVYKCTRKTHSRCRTIRMRRDVGFAV